MDEKGKKMGQIEKQLSGYCCIFAAKMLYEVFFKNRFSTIILPLCAMRILSDEQVLLFRPLVKHYDFICMYRTGFRRISMDWNRIWS
jgi:hypothetical protein